MDRLFFVFRMLMREKTDDLAIPDGKSCVKTLSVWIKIYHIVSVANKRLATGSRSRVSIRVTIFGNGRGRD